MFSPQQLEQMNLCMRIPNISRFIVHFNKLAVPLVCQYPQEPAWYRSADLGYKIVGLKQAVAEFGRWLSVEEEQHLKKLFRRATRELASPENPGWFVCGDPKRFVDAVNMLKFSR